MPASGKRKCSTVRGEGKAPPPFKSLLVRAPNWMGDTVMATPVLRVLRRSFPDARITVLARKPYDAFWTGFPGVDAVRSLDPARRGFFGLWRLSRALSRDGYDAGLLLTESFSSAFLFYMAGIPHRLGVAAQCRSFLLSRPLRLHEARRRHWTVEALDLLRRGWGLDAFRDPVRYECPLTPEGTAEADKLLKATGNMRGPWVAFACGATYGPAKRWPWGNWVALRDRILHSTNTRIALVGGREEAKDFEALLQGLPSGLPRVVSFAGKTSVNGLSALLARCRAAVANDSGPMHVAAGVGIPVLALFGSTSPAWTRPLGTGHKVLYRRAPCSPCFLKECPIDLRCLTALEPHEVWETLRPHLVNRPVRVNAETLSPEVPDGDNLVQRPKGSAGRNVEDPSDLFAASRNVRTP
jgi:heptosyltransferase II